MKQFVRITKLSNIGGRSDYITNEKKQECILAKSEKINWKPYQEFERNNQKSSVKNNEGRELIIALPNDWADLPPKELHARASTIAQIAVGKTTDLQWAVHWNHDRTNLHIHVIFSERQREKSTSRWSRDVYLTEDGKVARKKADRAKNPDGTYKPPVHRKGDEKGGFTVKDRNYASKKWYADTKERLKQAFVERWQVNIEEPGYFHQYHEGKGKDAPIIREKNEIINAINSRLNDMNELGFDSPVEQYRATIKEIMSNHQVIVPYFKDMTIHLCYGSSTSDMLEFTRNTQAEWDRKIASDKQTRAEKSQSSEQIPEPFTAILQAQRDYYRALFAWRDKRKPLNPALVDAPERFQNAVDAFFKAKAEEKSLWSIYRKYDGIKGFLHPSEKKQARANCNFAEYTANKLGEQVADYMHFASPYVREAFIRSPFAFLTNEPTPDVAQRIQNTLSELRDTIENARPDNIPEPSWARVEACEKHFREEARKIPFEQRETARELLRADVWNLKMGDRDTDASTRETVERVAKDFLPTPAEIRKQEQQHSRSISHKEKER